MYNCISVQNLDFIICLSSRFYIRSKVLPFISAIFIYPNPTTEEKFKEETNKNSKFFHFFFPHCKIEEEEMRGAIHIVTTRLSSCLRPILLLNLVSCSPRQFSFPSRLICSAATKPNDGGGRSGSIVAPPVIEQDFQKIDVNPPKGTRDFAPEDMRLRNWLFNHFKEVSVSLSYC